MLRGLETFSQLLVRGEDVELVDLPVDISDHARYGHRGLLVDTARHYIPVSELLKVVDSMVVNKMNVLHWHAVDAESFPLNTPSEPTMVSGAFNKDMIFEMSDLTQVRQYAFARGVEVVLEIDIPGHAASWTAGKKQIMADCFAKYYYNINDFALNPSLELTYITVNNILNDVTKALGSTVMHLGGDEVVYGCWKNDSSITAYMHANSISSYDAMLGYFVKIVDNNLLGTSSNIKTIVHWEEVYTAYKSLSKTSTVFQVWTNSASIATITAASYRVIASPSNYWYLNIPANTWQIMYDYDPTVGLSSTQAGFIIGGEAALWGEYVDQTNLMTSLYPKASAVAERLWSDPQQTPVSSDATSTSTARLLAQRCRMINRGFQVAPLVPGGYCDVNYV
jgi:hexosaminidase